MGLSDHGRPWRPHYSFGYHVSQRLGTATTSTCYAAHIPTYRVTAPQYLLNTRNRNPLLAPSLEWAVVGMKVVLIFL